MESHFMRWWENPSIKDGKQGAIVTVIGRDLRIECPKCHAAPVVYNGNYFCDNWGESCDWALEHPVVLSQDKEVCDLIGIDYY